MLTTFDDFFCVVRYLTNNKRLHFGSELDNDADPGIFNGIVNIAGWGNSTNFADNSKSCRQIFVNFFSGGMSH